MGPEQLRYGELLLPDPGLVRNSSDSEHCVHACFQMIFRSRTGAAVPSFEELDRLMSKTPGKYTYEYGLLADMPSFEFDTRIIWTLDLQAMSDDPAKYFLCHYGPEVGAETVANTDLNAVANSATKLLYSSVRIENRSPDAGDLVALIAEGFYCTLTINQRVLQADPGYVAHSILVYGASNRGVRIHNPGPPATAATEITWAMLEKAWAYPDESARNIMALRPRNAAVG